ncbi:YuzB family protein [Staphylococcus sp. SQ8-PEA]|uniref:YuzB family protein n=1 Tax=Staphylococcus marylandisciuri TaxID=2981529 RepID=A0ABT2QPN4_9STAP|nr:YuzB family protein [Staphylococcus marylandisciuri]MCU5745941.1 YuzB family protein [Staphylococcus marylandisciuri]
MFPLVEFCVSNMAKGGDYVFNKLEEDPNVDVLEYGCLQNCGICSNSLYALVDGEVVEGDTPDNLLSNIYAHIEKQQEAWMMF